MPHLHFLIFRSLIILQKLFQLLLAFVIVVLHPHVRFLRLLITRLKIFKKYLTPVLDWGRALILEPYKAALRRLPPYPATASIAIPLAILEPAKLYATILIAERPKTGIILWIVLQIVSLVLIDETWQAVRPQSRKVYIVSRLHAWGWLNYAYGRYWLVNSRTYKAVTHWQQGFYEKLERLMHRRSHLRR